MSLQACFILQPRSGFALQGFVPHRGAVPIFTGRIMPSCWLEAGSLRFDPRQESTFPNFKALLPALSAVSLEMV